MPIEIGKPRVTPTRPSTIPLNRFEAMFLAMSDVFDTMNQAYLLRYEGAVSVEMARDAARELVDAYPRLRAVLEPAIPRWRLRVVDDARAVADLFDDAFRVARGVDVTDTSALVRLHTDLLNDPLPIQRGLPVRFVFVPHPTTPILFFSVHHVVCDGRSMVQMVGALTNRLRGEPIAPQPIEDPSSWASILPERPSEWPRAILRSFEGLREGARLTRREGTVTLNHRRGTRFATTGLRHFDLPCPAHRVRAAAKAHGTTVNTLLNAAIAWAFLSMRPDDPDAVVVLRAAVDLRRAFPEDRRPVFGNFVTSFLIEALAGETPEALVASIDRQSRAAIERIDRHELASSQILAELQAYTSRKAYAWLLQRARSRGRLLVESAQTSNLGNGDRLFNPEGTSVRLAEIRATVPNALTMFTIVELRDRLLFTLSFRREDTDDAEVEVLLGHVARIVEEWASAGEASADPAAPDGRSAGARPVASSRG